jgi:hypothetical protein
LLEQNMDKIYWEYLSANPNAIHLLKHNMHKINFTYLSKNPSIFEINKKQLIEDIEKQTRIIDGIINLPIKIDN